MNYTPSFCQIDLAAIAANFRTLGNVASLMPVIKADAYGHGLLPVARTLHQCGAARFAVGLAQEGVALRQAGYQQPVVLLMGCHTKADWQLALRYQLTPIVGSWEDICAANAVCAPGQELSVAVKCDSGMGRLGFSPDDIATVIELLRSSPALAPMLTISHLACADMSEQSAYNLEQIRTFREFYNALATVYPNILPSLGNSAATLQGLPDDIGRPGLCLYGGDPVQSPDNAGLRWAMAVAAPIIHVHSLARGQSVSYGRLFTASAPTRVAVVACGYATGYDRNLSGKAEMLVHGRRQRQIGRVCMSMTMLDVTDAPDVSPGDLAWVLGGEAKAGQMQVNAWEMANLLDTIPYEILCRFGSMNNRVYING